MVECHVCEEGEEWHSGVFVWSIAWISEGMEALADLSMWCEGND